ncbi:carbohydrate kinase family protein [Zongyangia hominis]|uniref:Carbohydrate kinase family protein n=1 Tax=Zongyangia hominis TaxID=2763677 RepID=A0A926I6T9_9FIRM|nr:carbohydrate kinase family protein [Zongyangia hominis]MBC8570404.1 carbohydrate kinase family protein [Zongyangia hominis]
MMPDILAIGMGMVDIAIKPIPANMFDYDVYLFDSATTTTGGDALNCAIDCSKLGVDTGCIFKTGKDIYGRLVRETSEKYGIDISRAKEDPEMPTTMAVLCIENSGERSGCAHTRGVNKNFTIDDIDLDYVKQAKIVHYGSAGLAPKLDGEGIGQVFKACKEAGVVTAMDVCVLNHDDVALDYVKYALPYTDYFLPSDNEAAEISGKQTCEEFEAFYKPFGIKNLIVKLGAKGVFVTDFKERRTIPTFHVDQVRDVTGCGDSFCAAFLSAISWGWSIWEAAVFGNAVGSMNCQAVGATLGVKSREETMAYIRAHIEDVPEDLRARFEA